MNDIVSLSKWRKDAGVSRTWAWRARKAGVLNCVVVAGRPYLTAQAITEFIARAEAGDLAHISLTNAATISPRNTKAARNI